MKNWKEISVVFVAALVLCLFASCSNNSGGGGNEKPSQKPTICIITFNANDGSANPATVPQNFAAGVPKKLTLLEELGFSKNGFYFVGWGNAPKSKQASYVDGDNYTATTNETLYALWSEIPVYTVTISSNEYGNATASPSSGRAGKKITLSNHPKTDYEFVSYIVTDADGNDVPVTDGQFTMPDKNVTVSVVFAPINYVDYVITFNANDGSVTPATATQTFTSGKTKALRQISELGFSKNGYRFKGWGLTVDAEEHLYSDGMYFTADSDLTLYARWEAKAYKVIIPSDITNGTVTSDKMRADYAETVTLTITPAEGCELIDITVDKIKGGQVEIKPAGNNIVRFTMPYEDMCGIWSGACTLVFFYLHDIRLLAANHKVRKCYGGRK